MTSEHDTEQPEPVTVSVLGSIGEAEVAQAALLAFGVYSAIVDNDGGGAIPVAGDPGIALQVRAVDADAAAQILGNTAS